MTKVDGQAAGGISRRAALKGAASTAALLAAPALLTGRARAQASLGGDIDWKQASGTAITVGVIPAGYFQNLEALLPQFRELSGVDVRLESTPPGQIRQKAILDLSSKTGTWATSATDPMYYPLYVSNGWIDPLTDFLDNPELTDKAWFDYEDILESWRNAAAIDGVPYGIPYEGEATIQIYRSDVYEKLGLQPAETLEDYAANAAKANDPGNRLWGAALRGFKGAGQNMYIYPSILLAYGGTWFDGDKVVVNGPEAGAALEWYVSLLKASAPEGVENWNWPDIADAFGQGTVASYIDTHNSAAVIADPTKSLVGGKIGFARWPKGPSGRRVTSIWNWSFPINASISDKEKAAAWLFIQWAGSKELQAATSYGFDGAYKRLGVNRSSLWSSEPYTQLLDGIGAGLTQTTMDSINEDTDVDWRPRVPQWAAIGEIVATAVQAALVGQATPAGALDAAQTQVDGVMKQ
jgi:multiple sugar transport system substrate-binding protein